MPYDYSQLTHPGIRSLKPYVPGKSIEAIASEYGLSNIIKLGSNENPLGCSPSVKQALIQLTPTEISSYPSPHHHPLAAELSAYLGIDQDMLLLSNGSDFIFQLLMISFALGTHKHILSHQYSFMTYGIQAQTLGIALVITPVKSDWHVDIEALINACNQDTALIFLANPNNPTGLSINPQQIEELLKRIPCSTLLILDEAYYEYFYPMRDKTTINLLNKYSNLVITRTFSKAYGLAGLRLGYAIADPSIITLIERVQLPFTVNRAAMNAALVALKDINFLNETLALTIAGKNQIQEGLTSLNLNYIPSAGNFITFDCKSDASVIYQKLLQQGVIVRPLDPYGLFTYLRVTVGTSIQNQRFLDTLAHCL